MEEVKTLPAASFEENLATSTRLPEPIGWHHILVLRFRRNPGHLPHLPHCVHGRILETRLGRDVPRANRLQYTGAKSTYVGEAALRAHTRTLGARRIRKGNGSGAAAWGRERKAEQRLQLTRDVLKDRISRASG